VALTTLVRCTDRVERLKERALAFADCRVPGERAVLVTKAFRETEGLPMVIRNAKALEKVLLEEGVEIFDDELIVGRPSRYHFAHRGLSEKLEQKLTQEHPEWILDAIEHNPQGALRSWGRRVPQRPELEEVLEYWRGVAPHVPRNPGGVRMRQYRGGGLLRAHIGPNFSKVLRTGFNGIKAEAEARLSTLKTTGAEDVRKRTLYEAIIIVCDAIAEYGRRHAELARRMAEEEEDPRRRAELERIVKTCAWVPANPARDFYEAIQAVYFTHLIHLIVWGLRGCRGGGCGYALGRLDQYLYPYYERDLREGRITREEALELIECLWVKLYAAYDDQHTMIGGVKPDGTDGTNEVSHLCLEATARLGLPRDLGARIHKGTPREFLLKACEALKLGLSVPVLYNDDVIIPAQVRKGAALEDARDYFVVGCVEIHLPNADVRPMAGGIDIIECLELALNDGRCMITGEQLGPKTGDPAGFKSFDELMEAYKGQISHATRLQVAETVKLQLSEPGKFPVPFLSATIDDCMARGLDITEGGARYNATSPCITGIACVADSLAAVKRLVFEERRVSMGELVEALRSNFEGREELRQMLINRAPKFGNDDDYVDLLAREVASYYCHELDKYRDARGGPFRPLIFQAHDPTLYGAIEGRIGATPDGRRREDPPPMSVQPSYGRDLSGPTAALKSVAKIDYLLTAGGISNIIELHPTAVSGEKGAATLAALIRTYFDLGGSQVAVNVVGPEALREAQRHPERYRSLRVRVFGYSDYFVNLDSEVQEYLIQRASSKVGG